MVVFTKDNARLHIVIAKGYKDISKYDDPQLEACIYFVNQRQVFEKVFKWELKVDEATPNSIWIG
jgi:hypothetical protein